MVRNLSPKEVAQLASATPWWWKEYPERDCEYVRWYPPTLTAEAAERVWVDPPAAPPPDEFGVYIHFPFCATLCSFCPFQRTLLRPGLKEEYLKTLMAEIEMYGRTGYFSGPAAFVYFGGGTPSLMGPDGVETLLEALSRWFRLTADAEVTLEAHPRSVDPEAIGDLRRAGVTRFSLGLQSFQDSMLSGLGTTHDSAQGRAVVEAALGAGFGSVSLDLLFRLPGQDLGLWEKDLAAVTSLGVPHVSCYSLVLDPDSPLQKALNRRAAPPLPDEETDVAMSEMAFARLGAAGYRPYVLCSSSGWSFARPGHECRYDLRQWAAPQEQFLGLGVSSYGFARGFVTANTGSHARYHRDVRTGRFPLAGAVRLTREEAMCRYAVLGCKTGVLDKRPFRKEFGLDLGDVFGPAVTQLAQWGLVTDGTETITVTDRGRLYIDNISKAFYSPAMKRRPQLFQGGEPDEA